MSREEPAENRQSSGATILGVIGDEPTGISYVRFFQPFRHLASRGYRLATLGDRIELRLGRHGYQPSLSLLDGISLLMFPQLITAQTGPDGAPIDLVPSLCREARRRGIPIIYSVDDALDLVEPENPAIGLIDESRGSTREILASCSGAIVTTDTLRTTLAADPALHGKPIFTLPNAVDPDDWAQRPRKPDRLRVGWAGSSSHLFDLKLVLPAIRELQQRIDFELVLMGIVDTTIPEQLRLIAEIDTTLTPRQRQTAAAFVRLVGDLDGLRFQHVPFLPTREFVTELPNLDLDIGLCPLRDTRFNRHKSALKFYEYAATGTLCVASDLPPYRGEVSILAGPTTHDWVQKLEPLLLDAALRDRQTEQQVEYVHRHHTVGRRVDAWDQCLSQFLSNEGYRLG